MSEERERERERERESSATIMSFLQYDSLARNSFQIGYVNCSELVDVHVLCEAVPLLSPEALGVAHELMEKTSPLHSL